MASRYPNWRGSYTETRYPVRSASATWPALAIGFYGPFFLNDEDLAFINSLNRPAAVGDASPCSPSPAAWGCSWPGASPSRSTAWRRPPSGSPTAHRDVRDQPSTTQVRELDGIAAAVNDLSRALGRAGGPAPPSDGGHGARAAHPARHAAEPPRGADRRGVAAGHGPARGPARGDPEDEPPGRRTWSSLARYESDALELTRTRGRHRRARRRHRARTTSPSSARREYRLGRARPEPAQRRVRPADADKLSQAVINLLSQRAEVHPAGGSVEVRVGAAEGRRDRRVATRASASRPEDLPARLRALLPCRRVAQPCDRRMRASGFPSRGRSSKRTGEPSAPSSEPGKGSEFVISLPRATAGAVTSPSSAWCSSRAARGRTPVRSPRSSARGNGAGGCGSRVGTGIEYPSAAIFARTASMLTASG